MVLAMSSACGRSCPVVLGHGEAASLQARKTGLQAGPDPTPEEPGPRGVWASLAPAHPPGQGVESEREVAGASGAACPLGLAGPGAPACPPCLARARDLGLPVTWGAPAAASLPSKRAWAWGAAGTGACLHEPGLAISPGEAVQAQGSVFQLLPYANRDALGSAGVWPFTSRAVCPDRLLAAAASGARGTPQLQPQVLQEEGRELHQCSPATWHAAPGAPGKAMAELEQSGSGAPVTAWSCCPCSLGPSVGTLGTTDGWGSPRG